MIDTEMTEKSMTKHTIQFVKQIVWRSCTVHKYKLQIYK